MNVKRKSLSQKVSSIPTILDLLGDGADWRSGEEMAGVLGISRAAVAKQVKVLRDSGHVIESVTRLGYRLIIRHEKINCELVRSLLRTRVLGRAGWRILEETPSTNNEAIAWALSGGENGTVVTAERQTLGKGRKKYDWFSSAHALQFSIILRPRNNRLVEKAITRFALEAVAEALETACGITPILKQPNDILLNGKKVCGILTEAGSRAGVPDWMVLGIGCNINVMPDEFPNGLGKKATSLYAESGTAFSRNAVLAAFINSLEKRIQHQWQPRAGRN